MEGDIVTFKHRGFLIGSKKPKFPVLHRVRSDLAWSDVVANFKEQTVPGISPYTSFRLVVEADK